MMRGRLILIVWFVVLAPGATVKAETYTFSWTAGFNWPGDRRPEGTTDRYGGPIALEDSKPGALAHCYGFTRFEDEEALRSRFLELVGMAGLDCVRIVDVVADWPKVRIVYESPSGYGAKLDSLVMAAESARKVLWRDRGFRLQDDGTLSPNYAEVLSCQRGTLRGVARSLDAILGDRRLTKSELMRARLRAALSFVESAIAYERIPLWDEERFVCHWLPPHDVVSRGRGDCDSKAMLLCGVWREWYGEDNQMMYFVVDGGPDLYHMMVAAPVENGTMYTDYEGRRYAVCEVTRHGVAPGAIDGDWWRSILEGRLVEGPLRIDSTD